MCQARPGVRCVDSHSPSHVAADRAKRNIANTSKNIESDDSLTDVEKVRRTSVLKRFESLTENTETVEDFGGADDLVDNADVGEVFDKATEGEADENDGVEYYWSTSGEYLSNAPAYVDPHVNRYLGEEADGDGVHKYVTSKKIRAMFEGVRPRNFDNAENVLNSAERINDYVEKNGRVSDKPTVLYLSADDSKNFDSTLNFAKNNGGYVSTPTHTVLSGAAPAGANSVYRVLTDTAIPVNNSKAILNRNTKFVAVGSSVHNGIRVTDIAEAATLQRKIWASNRRTK